MKVVGYHSDAAVARRRLAVALRRQGMTQAQIAERLDRRDGLEGPVSRARVGQILDEARGRERFQGEAKYGGLATRARLVLINAGLSPNDVVRHYRAGTLAAVLAARPNCGKRTISEIEEWAAARVRS